MVPFATTLDLLDRRCLGVLGAGHLGRALASALVTAGFPRSNLLVCHRGAPETRSALEAIGLAARNVDIHELGNRCRVILVTLRPQDIGALATCPVQSNVLIVSFAAATALSDLPVPVPGARRLRVMPSAPFTINEGNGIAAVLQEGDPVVEELLSSLSLIPFRLESEDEFHAFTAFGPCLPIALTYWRWLGKEVDEGELTRCANAQGLAEYDRILTWALSVRRSFGPENRTSIQDFLASAATPGGVAEAILQAITNGSSLTDGLIAGVRRSRQLENDRRYERRLD